ncbi:MAG: hypothetical protein NC131_21645, partial [Roseburia sp.]|nr:hypothetical protein [Roseburia sp.]
MKKLLTIFSVFLVCNGFFCSNSWAAGSCRLHLCKTNEDTSELLSKDGQTKNSDLGLEDAGDLNGQQCFHCDVNNMWGGVGDDDCSPNTHVATINSDGTKRLFLCVDDSGDDDSWKQENIDNLGVCSGSVLPRSGISNAECKLTDNGTEINASQKVSSPCLMCNCISGYKAEGGTCVLDTSGKDVCENAPSYGNWNGSTCICNKDGQKDKDPGKTCECQSGLEFDVGENKCVDPNQGDKDKCRDSGGEWKDDVNPAVCVCSTTLGFNETPVDGKCVCANASDETYDGTRCVATDQAICTNSGVDWDGD